MAQFQRYVGIDYSGAQVARASLPGLQVFMAQRGSEPVRVPPPPSPRKYWSRREIAEWLVGLLGEGLPTVVGIDHAFGFPIEYFARHRLPHDWRFFLDDFQRHWPTDGDNLYVDFVRDGLHGNGAARSGERRWRRLAEQWSGARSPFHFDVQGSVAKSTHAGLPWLRHIRNAVPGRLHFWPFDGWEIPEGSSAVVEVYPALWNRGVEKPGLSDHERDAFVVAEWLRDADGDGRLAEALAPPLGVAERERALIEGWILGVMEDRRTLSRSAVKRVRGALRPVSPAPATDEKWPLTGRFEDAVTYALRVHQGQYRKKTEIPYASHLLAVCARVLEDGGTEDEAIAALLHDAVEDAGGSARLRAIRARFGDAVARIVAGCSDTDEDPKPPWRERKERYLRHLRQAADASTLRVSLADKLHNARAILRDHRTMGEAIWARFSAPVGEQLWYFESLVAVFRERAPGPMADELAEVVEAIRSRHAAAVRTA